jgi:hypothetical protein
MSNINTSGINTSYPTPGINNSTQGFRDNFASIKNSIDTAAAELSDLQGKVVVKAALVGTNLNNDMANTLISNAAVKGFRHVTFNMGTSIPTLPDKTVIDVTKADVHYGQIVGDTGFLFAGWPATGTHTSIQLNLLIANNQASINFPDTVYSSGGVIRSGMNDSMKSLENFWGTYANNDPLNYTPSSNMANVTHTNNVGIPAGVKEVQYVISTMDCGTTLTITPVNRSMKATQIAMRDASNDIVDGTGKLGDTKGTITTDGLDLFICVNDYPYNAEIETTNTASNWVGSQDIITLGKFGKESDTGMFKKGDGVNVWDDLSYYHVWKRVPLGVIGEAYPPG